MAKTHSAIPVIVRISDHRGVQGLFQYMALYDTRTDMITLTTYMIDVILHLGITTSIVVPLNNEPTLVSLN